MHMRILIYYESARIFGILLIGHVEDRVEQGLPAAVLQEPGETPNCILNPESLAQCTGPKPYMYVLTPKTAYTLNRI